MAEEKKNIAGNKQKKQMRIQIDEKVAKGAYSNTAFVVHNDNEFILDFIFAEPTRGQGHVVSRVITNPRSAKKLAAGLNSLVERYESRFGEIKMPEKEQNVDKEQYH